MGGLFSTPDISTKVTETVRHARPKFQELQRDLTPETCPGLVLSKMNSISKYKNFALADEYNLIEAAPNNWNKGVVCTEIRRREKQKVYLVDKILSSLEMYTDVLSWLIDGDYCATSDYRPGTNTKRWHIQRYGKDGMTKFQTASCDGTYIPLLMALDISAEKHDVAGALAWDKVYRLTDRENAKWRNMVDNLRSSFTFSWRKLKKLLEILLVPEVLTAENLMSHEKNIEAVLSNIEDKFQNFMHDALDKDMVRPLSIAQVKSRRLEKQVEKSELAAQKKVISEAKDNAFNDMMDTARAKWKMPLSGAPAVFNNEHFAKQLSF